MRSLCEAGVVEGETEAILIDNDIDFTDFSEEVNACLPTELPWTMPEVHIIMGSCHLIPYTCKRCLLQLYLYSELSFKGLHLINPIGFIN